MRFKHYLTISFSHGKVVRTQKLINVIRVLALRNLPDQLVLPSLAWSNSTKIR